MQNLPENYEENREIGENHEYIATLIRNDSIDEFISYFKRTDFNIQSTIPYSIYETNPFLLSRTPSLIEYAAFFGSVQVFKYLHDFTIFLAENDERIFCGNLIVGMGS